MNVETMRKIDRFVGVPLTFLTSIWLGFWKLVFFRRKVKPDVSRTLFIELSEMGSAILVDPAMRKLQDNGAELYFAIFRENRHSLYILNTIEEERIFAMRSSGMFVLVIDVIRFWRWCRRNRISTVIDLELFSRFTALLTALSGARSRVGFASLHDEGLYRGSIINNPVRYNPHVHISVNFVSLVNTALGAHDTAYPTQAVDASELVLAKAQVAEEKKDVVRAKIKEMFPSWEDEPLVIINANASDMLPQRRWLPDRFSQIAKRITETFPSVLLVATGAPGEREYVQNVVDNSGSDRFINSAGVFEFEELVPLYSISSAMLTNDSGPAHFAAVTDLRVFVIFGPESPKLYGPMGNYEPFYLGLPCSPCVSAANHRKTTCETIPCITGISTDMVFDRMNAYLKEVV